MLRSVLMAVLQVAWPLLQVVRWLWDAWVTVLFVVVAGWRRKISLPPVFNPVLLLSASQLAHDIRERKLTSLEVVRCYVTRISNVNPVLNALTQEDFQGALLLARRVDERLDQGYRNGSLTKEWVKTHQPLLGVPFTVTESISVAGLPHTGGLLAREGLLAYKDAQVVANLKRAGAIFIGSTNLSELSMWWDSDNPVYGRTSNPYDTRRSPGGASGGEAALMCACGTPLSVGTDTGGSIRTPAFFCGLFGHKPTAGVVSVRGCNLHQDIDTSALQCPGPLTRHAADLTLVLSVLAGDRAAQLSLGKKVNPGAVEVFSLEGDADGVLTSGMSRDLLRVQREVTQHYRHTYDCTVKKVRIPGLQWSYQIWREKLAEETQDDTPIYQQLADNKGEINVGTEVTRWLLGRPHHTLASLSQAVLAKVVAEAQFLRDQEKVLFGKEKTAAPSNRKIRVDAQWKALQMRIQRLLGHGGVLLYPSHPTQAPYHGESLLRPLNFTYAAIFNALGFPVTQVPLGLSSNGLPLGIQIVGGMHQDHLTIAMAEDLERHFGGWACPSKIP
ncbi:hypothetical protein O3P69_014416 [Scylla paramamosain]|uniref:Amidase domain-containing protein n=1 Tax=Scylla paramamosain TaxID=85552 RepID=A0AAW0TB16_SCYPA